MGTCSRTLIKGISKELFTELIKKNYSIGRSVILDCVNTGIFLDQMNCAFIISDAYYDGWIEVDLDFNKSIEEHDKFLIEISKKYNLLVLFGYKQTTSGEAKFLIINHGEVLRSIYQKVYSEPFRVVMEINFGEKLNYEKSFQYPEIGQDIDGFEFKDLDFYTDIQEMFAEKGYGGEKNEKFDEEYLHLEYLK